MKEFNMTSLHESLEQLSTPQLDAMLRAELEKEPPDEHAVRLILKVLREREKDYPVESNEQIDNALKTFQEDTESVKPRGGNTFLRVASVVIVMGILLFTRPQEASARSFFDRVAAWTDSIFELFSPSDSDRQKVEYVFKTDHPGLQEVYDTVTELGVTVPVVPMWLPDKYELVDCEIINSPFATCLTACFYDGERELVYEVNVFSQNVTSEFHKDTSAAQKYERNGVTHNVLKNEVLWVAVWSKGNIECSIIVDCQEDALYRILNSIYTPEE